MEHLKDEDIAAVAALLSSKRLGTFEAMAGSTRAAIARHQQMLQLAGTLMSITAVVERKSGARIADQNRYFRRRKACMRKARLFAQPRFQNSASPASTHLRRCHARLQTAFARSAALVNESA
jgi:hypothetical protein